MSSVENDSVCRDLYLGLLKKSLTGTLVEREPDADDSNQAVYAAGFVNHYINGSALTMLPTCRLENVRTCVAEIVEKGIPGDLIETGVWRGGATIFMRGLLKAYGASDRSVWVADSFEGLPDPDAERFPKEAAFHHGRTMQRLYKKMTATFEEVRTNFAAYGLLDDRVHFLKGWFKDTLPSAPIGRLALIRLDGDYYDSTMDALINLYDKLSVGGMVIVDDYGEDAWTNCRQAVDEFRVQRDIRDPLIRVDSKCYWWRRASLA
jgi:Macrocin-O-methyltransferase (TylF)